MKKILAVWFGLMLLVVGVVAAGCGGTDPSSAINNAIQKNNSTKSQHVDFNTNFQINGSNPQLSSILPINVTISGGADIDNNDATNPKAQGSIQTQGLDKLIGGLAQIGGSNGSAAMLGSALIQGLIGNFNFVVVNQHLYLNLQGTWYDSGPLSQLAGSVPGISGAETGTTSADAACFQGELQDTSKYGSNVLSNIQDVGTESINGVSTHHYSADINTDALLTQLANTSRDCGQAQAAGGLDSAKSQISGLFNKLSVDFWVSDDNQLSQWKVTVDVNPTALSNLAAAAGGTGTSGDVLSGISQVTLTAQATQSNFGASFNIQPPSGTILPLSELFGGLGLGGGTGGLGGGTGTSTSPFGGGTGTTGGMGGFTY